MPILPVTHQSWVFAPPLDVPLQVRLENGRFDSLRPRRLPTSPPCNVTIDHHPRGLGFVTNDNHITDIQVGEGDFVHEGEPFARSLLCRRRPHCTSSSGR